MTISRTFYSFYPIITPVRLASPTNISGTYYNGILNNGVGATLTISGGLSSIDGITLNFNDYVILPNQTNTNENGIYVVSLLGNPTILTRRVDFQSIEQIQPGQVIPVGAGNTLAGSTWVVSEPLPTAFGINGLILTSTPFPTSGNFLLKANNLSDVANVATARTNLGAQLASNIRAQSTGNIGGAGAGPITVPFTGLTAASIVIANVSTSTNLVGVALVTPGVDSFKIVFTADPGVDCTINFVAFLVAQ